MTPALLALFGLHGRVALVTGAGGGLGAATARVLAEAGAHVVVTDVDGARAAHVAASIVEAGFAAESAALDVTDQSAVDALVQDLSARCGRLDVVVNNAGVIADAPPSTMSAADLDRVVAVNLKGVVFVAQAAARVMVAAGRGSIVNITSGAVDMAVAAVGSYGASKAAAHQFSRSLALELGPTGVRVNAVAPGWVLTPMNERHLRGPDGTLDESRRADLIRARTATIPMRRGGQPLDIALAVLYLASDAASFVTGSVIRPNGGQTMPW